MGIDEVGRGPLAGPVTVAAVAAPESILKILDSRIWKGIKDSKKLSAKQREIVTLRIWEELSYKEIAEITGGTEGSVKMAFSRTINEVREKFGPLGVLLLMLMKQ